VSRVLFKETYILSTVEKVNYKVATLVQSWRGAGGVFINQTTYLLYNSFSRRVAFASKDGQGMNAGIRHLMGCTEHEASQLIEQGKAASSGLVAGLWVNEPFAYDVSLRPDSAGHDVGLSMLVKALPFDDQTYPFAYVASGDVPTTTKGEPIFALRRLAMHEQLQHNGALLYVETKDATMLGATKSERIQKALAVFGYAIDTEASLSELDGVGPAIIDLATGQSTIEAGDVPEAVLSLAQKYCEIEGISEQ
jgi:hypothetical protein